MSHQTRIDQFYKSVISKPRSDTIDVKKRVRAKSISCLKNAKGKRNGKRNLVQSQHIKGSKTVLDSIMTREEISIQHNEKEMKELWNHDSDIPLITSQNRLQSSSHYSQKASPNNIKMQLKEIPRNKLKDNCCIKEQAFADSIGTDFEKMSSKELKISDESNSSLSNLDISISKPEKINYTPKSPKLIQRKTLFESTMNIEIITQALHNMNLAIQKAIPLNNFNLKEIYSRNVFIYPYSSINPTISIKYKLDDIDLHDDLYGKILFSTVFSVFSNPVNCGYFDESELNFIYSLISLPRDPQMLLARMIKRKRSWFRISNINYVEISDNLKPAFDVLVSRHICTYNIEKENLYKMLELLQVDEILEVCRRMKIIARGTKKAKMERLFKLSNSKPLFPGMKSSGTVLHSIVMEILNCCVCITPRTWDIIDRIITLLLPNQDPKYTMSDTFLMLRDIYLKRKIFPNIAEHLFPVFYSKLHLQSYINAKHVWFRILKEIGKKNWEKIREYGNIAMDVLPTILETELKRLGISAHPIHIRRYMPGYIWLKILFLSIDAFKKGRDIQRVIEILNFLIEQNCHMYLYKGRWYSELALVLMHHLKNIERTVTVIMEALNIENLTQVDKVNLIERAKKVLKRKAGAKLSIQTAMHKVLDDHDHQMPKYEAKCIIIDGRSMPRNNAGVKTVWCVEHASESKSYGTVEYLALRYYYGQGFPSGMHCEGLLPIILFFTLFWEELYDVHIPGTFVTYYQDAPNDLFTEQFYENRKERIDMKLQIISRTFNSESLGSFMEKKFQICRQYQSVMTSSLQDHIQMKEIVCCLGVDGVIGICRRLIENFKLWKAGFPDLIVWNYSTKQHKIIEVKGPRDVLSTKQRLWLSYLCELGLNTEVCLVRAGVVSKLNSATGMPRCATCGANIAAGYMMDDVPIIKQTSQFSTAMTSIEEKMKDVIVL